jgi:hypothetical protein
MVNGVRIGVLLPLIHISAWGGSEMIEKVLGDTGVVAGLIKATASWPGMTWIDGVTVVVTFETALAGKPAADTTPKNSRHIRIGRSNLRIHNYFHELMLKVFPPFKKAIGTVPPDNEKELNGLRVLSRKANLTTNVFR